MQRKYDKILGIRVDSTSKARVLSFVRSSLIAGRKIFIATPNPEIVLISTKDKALAKILNKASLSLADGVGLAQAARFLAMDAPKNNLLRIPVCVIQGVIVGLSTLVQKNWLFKEIRPIKGREMFLELIALANKKGWKVFFFGGKDDEAQKTAQKLERNYKRVKIRYTAGPIFDNQAQPVSQDESNKEKELIDLINNFRPQLLFVALEPPKQEKWIGRWLPKLSIGGAMVVGGTFRYIAGYSPLPPKWMEKTGLEWIWRLLSEPWRLSRIVNAAVIFPLKVFEYKLKQK